MVIQLIGEEVLEWLRDIYVQTKGFPYFGFRHGGSKSETAADFGGSKVNYGTTVPLECPSRVTDEQGHLHCLTGIVRPRTCTGVPVNPHSDIGYGMGADCLTQGLNSFYAVMDADGRWFTRGPAEQGVRLDQPSKTSIRANMEGSGDKDPVPKRRVQSLTGHEVIGR